MDDIVRLEEESSWQKYTIEGLEEKVFDVDTGDGDVRGSLRRAAKHQEKVRVIIEGVEIEGVARLA